MSNPQHAILEDADVAVCDCADLFRLLGVVLTADIGPLDGITRDALATVARLGQQCAKDASGGVERAMGGTVADLALTRLDGGTRASVMCAVQNLDGLGTFVAAAKALVGRWFVSPGPGDLRTLAGIIDAAAARTLDGRAML